MEGKKSILEIILEEYHYKNIELTRKNEELREENERLKSKNET